MLGEGPALVLFKCDLQLLLGIHDDGTVPGDGLADWLARNMRKLTLFSSRLTETSSPPHGTPATARNPQFKGNIERHSIYSGLATGNDL